MPPLREREGDLELIANHVLGGICEEFKLDRRRIRLSPGAMDLIKVLPWTGNVRELENTIRSAVLFADGGVVTQKTLSPYIDATGGDAFTEDPVEAPAPPVDASIDGSHACMDLGQVLLGAVSLPQFKKEVERRCIAAALDKTGGNITRAASLLGMKRPRLSQLVKHYGIDRDANGSEE